jgi:hypothetical protein
MARLTERQLARVSTVLLDEVRAFAPDWTGRNESDPGQTLVELFAYLTEGLLFRFGEPAAAGEIAGAARRLARVAFALGETSPSDSGRGLRRVNYFAGQLLGEADFQDEQDYFRARLRRRNLLLGSGVVSGLAVSVAPGGGGTGQDVVVEPGFAIDPRGEEIEVCQRWTAALPAASGTLFVQLFFAESPAAPVPALLPEIEERYSRVEESFSIELSPAASPDGVSIARLVAARGGWRIDAKFKARRPPRLSSRASPKGSEGPP